MKFLINEDGGFVNWNGDIKTLEAGIYYLVKKVETIRIGNTNSTTSIVNNSTAEEEAWSSTNLANDRVETPNNDKGAGKIRYWQGKRYCELHDGKLERFAASDEPQLVDGKLFSGYYASGKFKWNEAHPVGFTIETIMAESEPIDVEPEPSPTTPREKKNKKKKVEVEVEVDPELESLKELAVNTIDGDGVVLDDAPFDEDAFLDDIAMPEEQSTEGSSKSWLDSDGLTLMVSFNGKKYKKRFKTEKVAASQLEVFKSLIVEDVNMAKELLFGSMSTFTEV